MGRGAEINHLTSGWSVHLCLGDRLQIGCDIQEHLGGHGSTFTHTQMNISSRPYIQTHVLLARTSNKQIAIENHLLNM